MENKEPKLANLTIGYVLDEAMERVATIIAQKNGMLTDCDEIAINMAISGLKEAKKMFKTLKKAKMYNEWIEKIRKEEDEA